MPPPLYPSSSMGQTLEQLSAIGILVGLCVIVYVAWRRRRLAWTFLAISVLFVGLWLLAYAAVATDYHDADGFTDCWPRCGALQKAAGGMFLLGPAAFIVVGLLAGALGALTALRGREGASPPPE
jgi:peptidoglycan/LPS O-acetylase OafA/YrhL